MDMDLTPTQRVLQEELEVAQDNIRIREYNPSIGGLCGFYSIGKLIFKSDVNGTAESTIEQKTHIIENLMIGMFKPSITVIPNNPDIWLDTWTVVEGEQWLKSVFQFMGEIEGRNNFRLKKPQILKSADGFAWSEDSFVKISDKFLSEEQRVKFMSIPVHVNVVCLHG